MKVPSNYFEPDIEPDCDYIHINDHIIALGEIESDVEQLIDELYDDCQGIDPDIIHSILVDICKKLEMKLPSRDTFKL